MSCENSELMIVIIQMVQTIQMIIVIIKLICMMQIDEPSYHKMIHRQTKNVA